MADRMLQFVNVQQRQPEKRGAPHPPHALGAI